jgi:hypothetical protein
LCKRMIMEQNVMKILARVAHFYDERKVGDVGFLGFRRSTDLCTLVACMPSLIQEGIIRPEESCFLDLGCADGRVNVFLSYVVKSSVGVELDEWTLEDYGSLRRELDSELEREGLPSPPENIFLFHGDSMDGKVHRAIF